MDEDFENEIADCDEDSYRCEGCGLNENDDGYGSCPFCCGMGSYAPGSEQCDWCKSSDECAKFEHERYVREQKPEPPVSP